jgi:hypothetical protein
VALGVLVPLTDTKFENDELLWTLGGTLILAPLAGCLTAVVFWYVGFLVDPVAALVSKAPPEVAKAIDKYEEDEVADWYDPQRMEDSDMRDRIQNSEGDIPKDAASRETNQGIQPKESDR